MSEVTGVQKGTDIKHWVQLKQGKAFWAWARQDMGLNEAEVHEACGVESMKDFEGTPAEARAAVTLWLDVQQIDPEEDVEESSPVPTKWLSASLEQDSILSRLAEPFPLDAISFKPGATYQDSCLALAYADTRAYVDRLNEVIGLDWSDEYEVLYEGTIVVCSLFIAGLRRTDVGEADPGDRNTVTSAAAQAFKRACAKFGLGRYLYEFPNTWVKYDAQKKRITEEGLRYAQGVLSEFSKGRAPAPGMSPAKAALESTKRGTLLGTLTSIELQQIVDARANLRPGLVEAAEVLLRFLAEQVGATDPDATHNSITGTQ